MPISNHVTSLELSRRLKELKVPQKSVFYWTDGMRYDGNYDLVYLHAPLVKEGGGVINTVSAYLASELGEFIGNALENGEDKDLPEELQPTTYQDIWKPDYLAKLLIWLIENHLISVEELGK